MNELIIGQNYVTKKGSVLKYVGMIEQLNLFKYVSGNKDLAEYVIDPFGIVICINKNVQLDAHN